MAEESELYGVAAEYPDAATMLAASAAIRTRNFGVLDAFSPLPIPGMAASLGMRGPYLGLVGTIGFLIGSLGCFGMITFVTVLNYPMNIAGRPLFSWPYYIIPSVALGTLIGAILVFVTMLFLDRLPRINHPVFNIDGFHGVTQGRLFLVVEARSEHFDPVEVEEYIAGLPHRPLHIQRIPR
jgi:hypothetical protein